MCVYVYVCVCVYVYKYNIYIYIYIYIQEDCRISFLILADIIGIIGGHITIRRGELVKVITIYTYDLLRDLTKNK